MERSILKLCSWSELPIDILRSPFERLSFTDFYRAKMVCSSWYLCSKQTFPSKSSLLMLMLFPKDDCLLYNSDEDKVYKLNRYFSGIRFLGSSGKWFFVLDSQSNLYIIDVFSGKKIDLPPLESLNGEFYGVDRLGDKQFKLKLLNDMSYRLNQSVIITAEDLRGVLWVDEKKGDYVVVWRFDDFECMGYCKKGDDHYREIPLRKGVEREFQGLSDMVLKGYSLYIYTKRRFIRLLDLSEQYGFKDVSESHGSPMLSANRSEDELEKFRADQAKYIMSGSKNIAVTISGDVLVVRSTVYESSLARERIFRLYKRDHNKDPDDIDFDELVKVDSLGDEALFLDLGITVLADRTLGIEPNCIYFTRHDRARHDRFRQKKHSCLDICVYNISTKTLKRFPNLFAFNLNDAHWFLPS